MVRTTTTPALVAAILRPVRSMMAGVARRMGESAPPAEAEVPVGVTDAVALAPVDDRGATAVANARHGTAALEGWQAVEGAAESGRGADASAELVSGVGEAGESPSIERPVFRVARRAEAARAGGESSAAAAVTAEPESSGPARLLFSMRRSAATRVDAARPSATPPGDATERTSAAPHVDSASLSSSPLPESLPFPILSINPKWQPDPLARLRERAGVRDEPSTGAGAGSFSDGAFPRGESVLASATPRMDAAALSSTTPRPDAAPVDPATPHVDAAGRTSGAPRIDAAARTSAAPPSEPPELAPPRKPLRLFFDPPQPNPAAPAQPGARPPLGPGVALADHIARATTPIWEDAHRITQQALTSNSAELSQSAGPAPSQAVSNTFNVSVHVDPERTDAPLDQKALEQALYKILRDAARRHGLEV